jgi:hypothetical protein
LRRSAPVTPYFEPARPKNNIPWGAPMLWTISSILLSLWLLAIATPSFFHGYVHILLLVAIVGMTMRFWPKKKDPID